MTHLGERPGYGQGALPLSAIPPPCGSALWDTDLSGRKSWRYSPECVEGKFCELRVHGVLRSSQGPTLPHEPRARQRVVLLVDLQLQAVDLLLGELQCVHERVGYWVILAQVPAHDGRALGRIVQIG